MPMPWLVRRHLPSAIVFAYRSMAVGLGCRLVVLRSNSRLASSGVIFTTYTPGRTIRSSTSRSSTSAGVVLRVCMIFLFLLGEGGYLPHADYGTPGISRVNL